MRQAIAYLLLVLLVASGIFLVWWRIRNSERNVRHRERSQRRARYKAGAAAREQATDKETGKVA